MLLSITILHLPLFYLPSKQSCVPNIFVYYIISLDERESESMVISHSFYHFKKLFSTTILNTAITLAL